MKYIFYCFMLIIIVGIILAFTSSSNLTDKDDVIALFDKNKSAISEAVRNDDFEQIMEIRGIRKVSVSEDYIEFNCGGKGFGSSTHYYGFFYSADDNLCATWCSPAEADLVKDGDGYKYEETNGDNKYYVEGLGDHFFYYEAHF